MKLHVHHPRHIQVNTMKVNLYLTKLWLCMDQFIEMYALKGHLKPL